jgi:hypothetical protein
LAQNGKLSDSLPLAPLIAFFAVIALVTSSAPSYKTGRFSLVNKEPGFTFDGNRSLDQVLSVIAPPFPESPESTYLLEDPTANEDQEKRTAKLIEKLTILGEKARVAPKLNISIDPNVNDLFSLSLRLLDLVLVMTAVATFFTLKYFS